MTTDEMTELKPCPFCGAIARLARLYNGGECAYCPNEDCAVQPELKGYLEPEEAITAWNTRADVSAPDNNGWQPIETAPRDGTPILSCVEGDPEPVIAWWDKWEYGCYWKTLNEYYAMDRGRIPTHWMPLPQPPALDKGE